MGERNNKRKAWGLWTLSDSPVRLPSGSLHLDQLEFRSINAARFSLCHVNRRLRAYQFRSDIQLTHLGLLQPFLEARFSNR
jgi:hypothetical protein